MGEWAVRNGMPVSTTRAYVKELRRSTTFGPSDEMGSWTRRILNSGSYKAEMLTSLH
jgi:hypothetical protein